MQQTPAARQIDGIKSARRACVAPWARAALAAAVLWPPAAVATAAESKVDEVRAVIPRAAGPVAVDGALDEAAYRDALVTPVEFFHPDAANRAAAFYYLWDDEAFYVGLRTLDAKTFSPETPLWEGDAVE